MDKSWARLHCEIAQRDRVKTILIMSEPGTRIFCNHTTIRSTWVTIASWPMNSVSTLIPPPPDKIYQNSLSLPEPYSTSLTHCWKSPSTSPTASSLQPLLTKMNYSSSCSLLLPQRGDTPDSAGPQLSPARLCLMCFFICLNGNNWKSYN